MKDDGTKEDITFNVEVGNGSSGAVAYSTYQATYNEEGKDVTKTLCQLVAIQVEDLIEYVSESGDGDGESKEEDLPESVFGGSTKLAEAPKNQKPVTKQSEAASPKKPKAASKPVEDDSDRPF